MRSRSASPDAGMTVMDTFAVSVPPFRRYRVGEAVGAVESRYRRISNRAVRLRRRGAMRRGAHRVGCNSSPSGSASFVST